MQIMEECTLNEVDKTAKVREILDCLILKEPIIERIKATFVQEMEYALQMQPSSLQMENTYIPELLDGTESGDFLAIDLGGTHLRVMMISLTNAAITYEVVQRYNIPDHLRVGCGNALFDYLAKCVDDFAVQHKLLDEILYPLGFTFSFPMRQKSLDSGVLVTWTKTFNCPSLVGVDVVEQMRDALVRQNRTNIKIVAILNDTTGTLMHGALLDATTRIGVVVGTGTNGCYMERVDRVKHWEQQQLIGQHHVIVDIEWGAFGDNGVLDFIKTEFDRCVDDASLLRNSFTFEKYIAGRYLGEMVRVVLWRLHKESVFLNNLPEAIFPQAWTFGSDNVSKIEFDTLNKSDTHIKTIFLEHFGSFAYTADDVQILRTVCGLISLRAAQLIAVTISMLLLRMDDITDEVTVAIDGSVYKHHPRLRQWIAQFIYQWVPSRMCKFVLAEDGSGKGAALVAAIAEKLQKNKEKLDN